MNEHITDR